MDQEVQHESSALDSEQLVEFADALLSGDFTVRLPVEGDGPAADAARRFNHFAQHMHRTITDLTRLSNELRLGVFGGTADGAVSVRPGPWRECLEAFNAMEWALTDQMRHFSRIATRLAAGRADKPTTVECHGETQALKDALNALLEQKEQKIKSS
jgi:methyl-accepting chemotaxis protein